jgi:hypothetical protein
MQSLLAWFKRRRKFLAMLVLIPTALCGLMALYGHIDLYLANRAWVAAGGWFEEPETVIPTQLPDEQNAAYFYGQAEQLAQENQQQYLNYYNRWKAATHHMNLRWSAPTDLSKVDIAQTPPIIHDIASLIRQGAQLQHCRWFDPAQELIETANVPKSIWLRINSASHSYRLTDFLHMEAAHVFHQGDEDRAVQILIDACRLSNHQKPTDLIHTVFWVNEQLRQTLVMLRTLFNDSHADLTPLLPLLCTDEIRPRFAQQFITETQYHINNMINPESKDYILGEPKQLPPDTPFWMPRYADTVYELIWSIAPGAQQMDRATARRQRTYELRELQKSYHLQNPPINPAKTLEWKLLTREQARNTSFDWLNQAAAEQESWIALARLAIQLRQYRATHGQYPETLSEQTLPAPINPATGQPVTYQRNPEGFTITGSAKTNPIVWTWK